MCFCVCFGFWICFSIYKKYKIKSIKIVYFVKVLENNKFGKPNKPMKNQTKPMKTNPRKLKLKQSERDTHTKKRQKWKSFLIPLYDTNEKQLMRLLFVYFNLNLNYIIKITKTKKKLNRYSSTISLMRSKALSSFHHSPNKIWLFFSLKSKNETKNKKYNRFLVWKTKTKPKIIQFKNQPYKQHKY